MNNHSKSREQKTVIALQYDGENAPRVTAKGTGLTAENILRIAQEHGIPLHENSSLASALSCIPLDQEIPQELYQIVAEILAFIYAIDDAYTIKLNI